MSFFDAFKRALGFGPDPDLISDSDTVDDPDVVAESADASEPRKEAEDSSADTPAAPSVDPDIKARIFDGAVAVFNEALPSFLRDTVDAGAQSKKLAEALDKGLDEYLTNLMSVAEQYAEARLKGAADTARRDAEKLRADMQLIEQQRVSLREQQLSADRRRRALSDRVTDLEQQLANAEAEREQYELENRSLLNKLRVADVTGATVAEGAVPAVATAELKEARTALAEAKSAAEQAEATAGEFRRNAEESMRRAEAAEKELADARNREEMTLAMYNDLQNTLVGEKAERRRLEESLAEAKTIVDSVAQLQLQMGQVEELIRKRDERIEKLKSTNKRLREQLAEKEKALEAVHRADRGLFNIDAEADEAVVRHTAVKSEDLGQIEDEFECPDWFVSEPPPGEVSPLLQSDVEFGYQEPPRKPRKPENDAQLSLF
jgi:myosin heavy subunit